MYFESKTYPKSLTLWVGALKAPWLGELILGMQGAPEESADPPFTLLREMWNWNIQSMFDALAKPILFFLVLIVSLAAFYFKFGIMIALLPIWILITVAVSIRFGLPDYPQTWMT